MFKSCKSWIVGIAVVASASVAVAQSPLNASATMRDNLNSLMAAKKPVTIVLENGQTYRAAIGSVGDRLVVLSGPSQKEFFDVLVVIDEIVAIEAQARTN